MWVIRNLKYLVKLFFASVMLVFCNFSYAQYSTNSSIPFTVDFVNGISLPMGDLEANSEPGFMNGFVVNKNLCSNISIGLNTNYTALTIKNKFGYSNEKWSSFSMSIGPQYHLAINKVFVEFYGKFGFTLINIPEATEYYPETDLIVSDINESNTSGLNTRFGINIGTQICKGMLLFASTEYNTNFNGDINYQTRDLSPAMDKAGEIDRDLASEIPLEHSAFSFSTMNINFGIRINLFTPNYKGTSNRRGISSGGDINNEDSGDAKAQDHNASRSNTTSSVKSNPDGDADNEDSGDAKAQDHNASRSNTTSSVKSNPDGDADNEDSGDAKAQYHNASRSNTTSSVKSNPDGDLDNEDSGDAKAQDHNASRSNTTSSVKSNPDGDLDNEDSGDAKAQDHNASRSNTTSSVKSNPDGDNQNSTLSFSKMLIEMDLNKDKRISKSEAKGELKSDFDKRDINKDGYYTEDENKKFMK
jgi:hypothetical protein